MSTILIPEVVINPGRADCNGEPTITKLPDGRCRVTCPDCGSDLTTALVKS